jgi:predicted dehydrogenase
VRILIVGLGSIGTRHLRIARQLFGEAEIKVLRHTSTKFFPEFSDGVFTTIGEAIAFKPDIAVISNPATLHIETAQALAIVGAHLLVEKPLSASLVGVSQLIETSKHGGTVLTIGYNLRFSPSLKQFKKLLAVGIIGRPLSVRCEVGQYLPSWRTESDYRQSVSGKRELGGGVLLELSHELDYLRWIFGEIAWVRATLSRQSNLEIDVEDSAHLVLGFSPNTKGQQLTSIVNLDFIRHDPMRLCTVIGENGSLRWNGVTGEVAIYRKDSREWIELFRQLPQRDETYISEWKDLLSCIKEKRIPTVTGEDGLRVVEIIEAARKSTNTGIQVAVASFSKINGTKR